MKANEESKNKKSVQPRKKLVLMFPEKSVVYANQPVVFISNL